MIQSFINTPINLLENSASVVFQRDCIRTNSCQGCNSWLCHNEGSANYSIVTGGIYTIHFNATISSADAGVVALALFNNGEMIPGTLMTETVYVAGDYANVSITKDIKVCCNGASNITVRAVPTVPTITAPTTITTTEVPIIGNANLIIDRKC